jgi:hypothetical protein
MRTSWLLLCLPSLACAEPLMRSEGVASAVDGKVVYREVHWQRGLGDGSERWVQYLCPDGRPFARKAMPATALPQARGYLLQDRRSGQVASVKVANRTVTLNWKEDASSPERDEQMALPVNAVIDAGFDAAVRSHWSALMRGERVRLPFLVPSRERFFPVEVRRTGEVRWQGQPAHAMEVKLDTWYGGIAPRLSLTYAQADRRLLEFRGTSNLRDAGGRYPQVTVRFAEPPVSRLPAEWQQAMAQPLVDRCDAAAP